MPSGQSLQTVPYPEMANREYRLEEWNSNPEWIGYKSDVSLKLPAETPNFNRQHADSDGISEVSSLMNFDEASEIDDCSSGKWSSLGLNVENALRVLDPPTPFKETITVQWWSWKEGKWTYETKCYLEAVLAEHNTWRFQMSLVDSTPIPQQSLLFDIQADEIANLVLARGSKYRVVTPHRSHRSGSEWNDGSRIWVFSFDLGEESEVQRILHNAGGGMAWNGDKAEIPYDLLFLEPNQSISMVKVALADGSMLNLDQSEFVTSTGEPVPLMAQVSARMWEENTMSWSQVIPCSLMAVETEYYQWTFRMSYIETRTRKQSRHRPFLFEVRANQLSTLIVFGGPQYRVQTVHHKKRSRERIWIFTFAAGNKSRVERILKEARARLEGAVTNSGEPSTEGPYPASTILGCPNNELAMLRWWKEDEKIWNRGTASGYMEISEREGNGWDFCMRYFSDSRKARIPKEVREAPLFNATADEISKIVWNGVAGYRVVAPWQDGQRVWLLEFAEDSAISRFLNEVVGVEEWEGCIEKNLPEISTKSSGYSSNPSKVYVLKSSDSDDPHKNKTVSEADRMSADKPAQVCNGLVTTTLATKVPQVVSEEVTARWSTKINSWTKKYASGYLDAMQQENGEWKFRLRWKSGPPTWGYVQGDTIFEVTADKISRIDLADIWGYSYRVEYFDHCSAELRIWAFEPWLLEGSPTVKLIEENGGGKDFEGEYPSSAAAYHSAICKYGKCACVGKWIIE